MSKRRSVQDKDSIDSPSSTASTSLGLPILYHELRTPLTGILGNLSLINSRLEKLIANIEQHSQDSDMQINLVVLNGHLKWLTKKLKTVERCSRDQLVLLNDALDLNKLEETQVSIESKPFLILDDLLRSVIETYSDIYAEKKIDFITELPEHDVALLGDSQKLKQILTNLLNNAFKFAKPINGTSANIKLILSMTEESKHHELCFQIQNSSPGLEKIQIDKLFQAYFQTDNHSDGTGLGLMICRRLLTAMGGDIQCTSEMGKWVKFAFKLTLPTATKRSSLTYESEKIPKRCYSPLKNMRILLVEDNIINQGITAKMLKKFSCEVKIAANGQEAFDNFLRSQKPLNSPHSLILMDINMPVMNGIKATQKIRQLDQSIPIIGLSANSMEEEKIQKIGMTGYLTKPLDEKALYDKIAQYYSNKSESSSSPLSSPITQRSSPSLFTRRLAGTSSRQSTPPSSTRTLSISESPRSSRASSSDNEFLPNLTPDSKIIKDDVDFSPVSMQATQKLAEITQDPTIKAQVLLQTITYHFSKKTDIFSSEEDTLLKKSIDELNDFYKSELTAIQRASIATAAIGSWQLLKMQATQCGKNYLEELATEHLRAWHEKANHLSSHVTPPQRSHSPCLIS